MIPSIIYGTAWKAERTTALVVQAVLQGFRAIDTAGQRKHYREDLVGEALQTLYTQHGVKREDLCLQTKYTSPAGQDLKQPIPYDLQDPIPAQVRSSFEQSLTNLRTTYLDSYILHSPLPTLEGTLEAWRVLAALQDEGKVRTIGVSNTYDVGVLEALARERTVQVVQNRWYEGNNWDYDVCAYCRKNGIQYQFSLNLSPAQSQRWKNANTESTFNFQFYAHTCMYNANRSFWTLSGSPRLLKNDSLLDVARGAGCTPAQALFRLAQTQGVTPLCGTTDVQHMQEAVRANRIEFGESTQEQVRDLVWFIWDGST